MTDSNSSAANNKHKLRTTPPTLVAIRHQSPAVSAVAATQTVPVEVELPSSQQTLVLTRTTPPIGNNSINLPIFNYEPIMTRARKRRIDQTGGGNRKQATPSTKKSACKDANDNPVGNDDLVTPFLFYPPRSSGGDVQPVDLALPSRVRQQENALLLPERFNQSPYDQFRINHHHHVGISISGMGSADNNLSATSGNDGPTQKYKRKRVKNL